MLENNLLGCLLYEPKLYEQIHTNIFTNKDCIKLYNIIKNLHEKNGSYTKDTVLHFIQDDKHYSVGTFYKIYEGNYEVEKFKVYLNDVLKTYYKERFKELYNKLYIDDYKNHMDIKYEIQKFIDNIVDKDEIEIKDSKDICREMLERLRDDFRTKKIMSCVDFIDTNQGGFDETDYIIIGAGESVGKTSYVLDTIVKQVKNKMKVGFISCEMLRDKIYQLFVSNITGISNTRIDLMMLNNEEKQLYMNALDILYTKDLYVLDRLRYWSEIKKKIRIMKEVNDIDICYIDYLQYLRVRGVARQYERLEEISTGVKELCKELRIPIIMVAQLNREGKKADRPPINSDIKGNGDIEYDADVIILLNEIKQDIENINRRLISFHISKNRNGRRGIYRMNFFPECRRFKQILKV